MNYSEKIDIYEIFLQIIKRLSPILETYRKLELEKNLIIETIDKLLKEHSIVKHDYYRDENSKKD